MSNPAKKWWFSFAFFRADIANSDRVLMLLLRAQSGAATRSPGRAFEAQGCVFAMQSAVISVRTLSEALWALFSRPAQ